MAGLCQSGNEPPGSLKASNRDGVVNFRNQHVWADENPHAVEETRHQHRFSINLRAGVLGDRLTTEINWGPLSGLFY
ncbi:hypothetical protein ANN_24607 [Periplaneta americana]|uniref:Uncharacterized protein n=1 Tax=Periplaneta americana TaxID=6978 RepID=A0ABQ8S3H0_PERAM|nr:hypothetical protein ANN_24607 [Periplaneta americana]